MQRQRVAGAALLPVGRHHRDVPDTAAGVGQEPDAGRQDAVVVADQDVHQPAASPRSARSVTSRPSRICEHLVHFLPQLPDRLRAHGALGRAPQLAGAAVMFDLLAGAFDGVLLGVEQVLDEHDQLDFAALVDPVARAVLGRVEEPELAFPVPQHMRLQVRQRAHLADGEELLGRTRVVTATAPP